MQKEFNLFVQLDALKSAGTESEWIFEGIASTADEDLYGEVVYPESFINSIDFFKSNGKIFFNHEYAQKNADWLKEHGFTQEQILALKLPIGKPLDAQLTTEGLYIKAALNKAHPLSSFVWNSFINSPDDKFRDTLGLSIGAKYLGSPRREYSVQKGKYITYLPELLLYEVSVTPEPVNPNTRTWAYAMKGMMKDVEAPKDVSYHTITPDEVLYDEERDRLVVKSTVTGGSGATHVFETYIDIKEDIKPMKKDKTLKALDDSEQLKQDSLDVGEDLDDIELDEADDDTAALDDDTQDLAGDEEDVADDTAELGEDDGGVTDDAVDSLLSGLTGDDSGAEPQEDESQLMILDKLDAILDALQTLAGGTDLSSTVEDAGVGEVPGAGQVNATPPALKAATVELSDESTEKFGAALKSILNGWEDRVVEKIINKLTNETTVVKSVISAKEEARILHPGVSLDASTDADEETVQKSVVEYNGSKNKELSNEQMDTLKGFIGEYVGIVGYGTVHAQQRGRVIKKVEDNLGISQAQFYQHVKNYELDKKKK